MQIIMNHAEFESYYLANHGKKITVTRSRVIMTEPVKEPAVKEPDYLIPHSFTQGMVESLKRLDVNHYYGDLAAQNNWINKTVVDFVGEGEKINAIKVVRGVTGLGLRESKDFIDLNWDRFHLKSKLSINLC